MYIVALTLTFCIAKITIKEVFNNKPIKFERYINEYSFKQDILKRILNKDINEALDVLQRSGMNCKIRAAFKSSLSSDAHIDINAINELGCYYKADFISLSPMAHYSINAQVDNKNRIIKLYAYKINPQFAA